MYSAVGPTKSRFAWQYGTMLTIADCYGLLPVVKGFVQGVADKSGPCPASRQGHAPGLVNASAAIWEVVAPRPGRGSGGDLRGRE